MTHKLKQGDTLYVVGTVHHFLQPLDGGRCRLTLDIGETSPIEDAQLAVGLLLRSMEQLMGQLLEAEPTGTRQRTLSLLISQAATIKSFLKEYE
jgi:hypothetical protein